MEFSIKLHKIKSGWSIEYTEGSHIILKKNSAFLSLKIDFVLAHSADPNEMPVHVKQCRPFAVFGIFGIKHLFFMLQVCKINDTCILIHNLENTPFQTQNKGIFM